MKERGKREKINRKFNLKNNLYKKGEKKSKTGAGDVNILEGEKINFRGVGGGIRFSDLWFSGYF